MKNCICYTYKKPVQSSLDPDQAEATNMNTLHSIRESLKARLDRRVLYPALWRFVAWQLLGPAKRLNDYRQLSARMLEDTIDKLDDRCCQ